MGQNLPISQIMKSGLPLSCDTGTPIAKAAARMAERGVSSILVTQGDDVVGIWTERDALAVDFSDPRALAQPIHLAMSSPVISLPMDTPVGEAAMLFREERVRHALVVDMQQEPTGILSQTDLALNQGLEPYLRLREVRTSIRRKPLVVKGRQRLSEVAAAMHQEGCDAVVVDCGVLGLGILTERDVVRLIALETGDAAVSVVATRPVLSIHEDEPLIHARDLLLDHSIRHLVVVDRDGEVVGVVGFSDMLAGAEQIYLQDLREALEQRDRALAKSRQSLQLAERVIESSFEGIIVTDEKVRIEFVNPAFTQLTGYQQEEVIGKTPEILSSGRHDAEFYQRMWASLNDHGYWRGEIWNRRKTGELYLELLTITAIRDDDGRTTHYAGLFTDITQHRKNEEQIRQLAYYDSLTGVPNRRLLEDRLAHGIRHAHRKNIMLAVLFMDVDHFKEINDRFGHSAGDELLLQFTRRVQGCLREDDTLARLGGDEFIVMLPEMESREDILHVAERLVEANRSPYLVKNQEMTIGSSIGISLYPCDGTTTEQLLHAADIAMYQAKRSGKNRYELFAPLDASIA